MDKNKKQYKDLEFGDIIYTYAPYEETTNAYYNGYTDKEIRGEEFNINGYRAKARPVMVVAVEDDKLLYANITSSTNNASDRRHQYSVRDNSMTPGNKRRTYVEIDNIREKDVKLFWSETYYGKFNDRDLSNIKSRMIRNALTTDTKDRHAFIGTHNTDQLKTELKENNFIQDEKDENKFTRRNYSITVKDDGTIYHHFERSKDEVRLLIEEYEGIKLKTLDDIDNVTDNQLAM